MAYDAILVPACETLRRTTLERLEAFQKAGGKLIFLGDAPKYEDAIPSERGQKLYASAQRAEFTKDGVLAALEPVRTVDIRNDDGTRADNFIHQLRQDGQDQWLFIAHGRMFYHRDVPKGQKVLITVSGIWNPEKWDTQTGDITPLAAVHRNGKTVISVELFDLDSLFKVGICLLADTICILKCVQ